MINLSEKPVQWQYYIDVGRPTFFDDEQRAYWKKFHDQVKNSPICIEVNGIFSKMDEMIEAGEGYGGGAFKYMFWFETHSDKMKFIDELEKSGWTHHIWTGRVNQQLMMMASRRVYDKYGEKRSLEKYMQEEIYLVVDEVLKLYKREEYDDFEVALKEYFGIK